MGASQASRGVACGSACSFACVSAKGICDEGFQHRIESPLSTPFLPDIGPLTLVFSLSTRRSLQWCKDRRAGVCGCALKAEATRRSSQVRGGEACTACAAQANVHGTATGIPSTAAATTTAHCSGASSPRIQARKAALHWNSDWVKKGGGFLVHRGGCTAASPTMAATPATTRTPCSACTCCCGSPPPCTTQWHYCCREFHAQAN